MHAGISGWHILKGRLLVVRLAQTRLSAHLRMLSARLLACTHLCTNALAPAACYGQLPASSHSLAVEGGGHLLTQLHAACTL
jgi:hypothetical protein